MISNPWAAWLEDREKKPAWYWMHLTFGKHQGDKACRGCAFLEARRGRDFEGNFYTTLKCSQAKKRWNANYPACGLWKKKVKK